MYIDFQQNRVCRSVKTVHTNLSAQYRKLHKFATTNSNFEEKTIILDIYHHKMYMYINFQQNQVKTQVMTVSTRYQITTNKKLLTQTDGTTDRQTYTDEQTNGHAQTDGRTDIAIDNIRYFFRREKNAKTLY